MLTILFHLILIGFYFMLHAFLASADTNSLRSKFLNLKIKAILPGDADYKRLSSAYNQRFSLAPAGIVFPNDAPSVSSSIKVAVEEGLKVSSRSGGHSYTAFGLGGRNGTLVIDLSGLKQLTVDQSTGVAIIGTGNRLGDVALGLYSQGARALPHGTCPYVGIGGHAAYGGFGYPSRLWGLTLDNIIAHEIVLADGSIIQASKTSNPDLFWALKGAGASYGIMTSIQFQTYSAPVQVTKYSYEWDFDVTAFADALSHYQIFCNSDLPAGLGVGVTIGKGASNGRMSFTLNGYFYGPSDQFDALLQLILAQLPKPNSQTVTVIGWIASLEDSAGSQALSTAGVDFSTQTDTFYAKSLTTPSASPMSNSSIKAFAKYLSEAGSQSNTNWFIQIELYGGKNSAITKVKKEDTAFAQRSILWTIQFYASAQAKGDFPANGFTFVDGMVSSIVDSNPPGWQYGAYANYIDDRLRPDQWKSLYYNTNYPRLTQIKAKYDPQQVFSFPQSIERGQTEPPTRHALKSGTFQTKHIGFAYAMSALVLCLPHFVAGWLQPLLL